MLNRRNLFLELFRCICRKYLFFQIVCMGRIFRRVLGFRLGLFRTILKLPLYNLPHLLHILRYRYLQFLKQNLRLGFWQKDSHTMRFLRHLDVMVLLDLAQNALLLYSLYVKFLMCKFTFFLCFSRYYVLSNFF